MGLLPSVMNEKDQNHEKFKLFTTSTSTFFDNSQIRPPFPNLGVRIRSQSVDHLLNFHITCPLSRFTQRHVTPPHKIDTSFRFKWLCDTGNECHSLSVHSRIHLQKGFRRLIFAHPLPLLGLGRKAVTPSP
jgi:hypothetical protein